MGEAKQHKPSNVEIPDKPIVISDIERKRIMEAIQITDTEKFLLFTRLMRIHLMLENAMISK